MLNKINYINDFVTNLRQNNEKQLKIKLKNHFICVTVFLQQLIVYSRKIHSCLTPNSIKLLHHPANKQNKTDIVLNNHFSIDSLSLFYFFL